MELNEQRPQLTSIDELRNALFDLMSDGVLIISSRGIILDCNSAFHNNLGYPKEQLIGTPIADLDPPTFAAKVPQRMAQIREHGTATFETAHYRKDGSVMPVELNAHCFTIDGELVYFSIVRDITDRMRHDKTVWEGFEVYQAAINTPALGFWISDSKGHILEVNDAYIKISGYNREELLGMRIPDLEAKERPEETEAHIKQIIDEGYGRFRSLHRRKDGTTWPVEIVTTFSRLKGGLFFVFAEDITDKVAQESQLELANRVFDTMEQAVVITDADNRIISINPATSRITGYTLEEVEGKNPRIFASGRHSEAFYAAMWHALNTEGQWEGEIWDRRKDGSVYAKWQTIKAIYDHSGRLMQYVSIFSDITERKRTEELIWRQANFDSLTGLPNRYLLHERLEQEIKKAHRSGARLAVFFIDLDRFKEVNDTLGHAKGDELLIEATNRIRAHVRESDTIARLGGDEFTVVLPDSGETSDLERIAQNLIDVLSEPYDLGSDSATYISASIGITLYPEDAEDLEELLKHADQAMYVAKADGRNRFSYFTPSMQAEAREKLALTNDLRQALSRNQLQVVYQPIIDLHSGEVVKAEALLRWHHPDRGMVSPAQFIPLAEESGLIYGIGDWVFRQSVQCIKVCRDRYQRVLQISVNKSPIQFERSVMPQWEEQLQESGLPGNSITIEITEGSLLSQSQNIKDRLLQFRSAGIEVSIDDFGTGFSALSYLHRFDIDYLKIDRSFIADLERHGPNTALTEAIIVMAHKLGIKAIAEGVETPGQHALLQQFGCDYAQGYFYGRPMPQEQFEALLSRGATLPH